MNALVRFALTAFFPRVGDVPGLAELGVDDKLAALRRDTTALFWLGLVGAALFFQLSPILTLKKPLLAAWLDDDELDLHADRIATFPAYPVRQIIVLLKLVAGMLWGQSPEIRARIALPPYAEDPGTRRTERVPPRFERGPRAPVEQLVTLGRREDEKGRGNPALDHSTRVA